MKFVSWLLTVLILVVALCFALNNRQTTTISLWPAGVELQAPLYLLTLGTLFVGVLMGAVIGWISHLPHRMEARRLRRDIAGLREKIEDISVSMPAVENRGDQGLLSKPKSRRFFGRS